MNCKTHQICMFSMQFLLIYIFFPHQSISQSSKMVLSPAWEGTGGGFHWLKWLIKVGRNYTWRNYTVSVSTSFNCIFVCLSAKSNNFVHKTFCFINQQTWKQLEINCAIRVSVWLFFNVGIFWGILIVWEPKLFINQCIFIIS